jgi:hypothetical protein
MPGALYSPFGRYELGTTLVSIGRSSSNTLVVQDDQVSGRHLQVQPQGSEYLVIDLGSSNGTTVNGQPLPPHTSRPLRNGDVLVLGGTVRIVVELPSAQPAMPPPMAQPGPLNVAASEQFLAPGPAPENRPFGAYPPAAPAAQPFGPPAQNASDYATRPEPPQQYAGPAQAPQAPLQAPAGPQQPFGMPVTPQQPLGMPAAPQQPFGMPAASPQPFSAPGMPQPSWTEPAQQPFGAQAPASFAPPAGAPPGAFPAYPGGAPAPAPGYYPGYPGQPAPEGMPPGYAGPGMGGPPPAGARAKNKRPLVIGGGVLAALIILVATGLVVYNLTRPKAPIQPNVSAQTITPFYNALERQDYPTAAKFFTTAYTQQHTNAAHVATLLQTFDTIRGKITSYKITHTAGSTTAQTATVTVTRDPTKGKFGPDTLQLVYQQNKWQISQWTPGPAQT